MRLKVKEAAERLGTGTSTILKLIGSGALVAVDVSPMPGGRPSWRISEEAIADFEAKRASKPDPPPAPKQRRKKVVVPARKYFPQ